MVAIGVCGYACFPDAHGCAHGDRSHYSIDGEAVGCVECEPQPKPSPNLCACDHYKGEHAPGGAGACHATVFLADREKPCVCRAFRAKVKR